MSRPMSSRERLLAAIERRPVDRLPLCFEGICHGSVVPVNRRFPDPFERALHYLARGVDHAVQVSPPWGADPACRITQEARPWSGEAAPVLVKDYHTPDGVLQQAVRPSADYGHRRVPLFSDRHVPPTRSLRYLVRGAADLPALAHVLGPPPASALAAFQQEAATARAFCDEHDLLLAGYAPGVGDPVIWLSGIEPVLLAAVDAPDFLQEYVDVVSAWNRRWVTCLLDAGVDVVVRRGWYESTDFWSPALFRRFLWEPLRQEAEVIHGAGAKLSYVMNTGAMPLLEMLAEAGIDVLSNLDPAGPGMDLAAARARIGGRVCLCGGVNNTLVLEQGEVADVEAAVRQAIAALGPGPGVVLAPGDSVGWVDGLDETRILRNVDAMIAAAQSPR